MALLRKELAEKRLGGKDAFDCLVESSSDFTNDDFLKTDAGVGSMAYCIGDEKVYAKKSTGWAEV